MSELPLDRIEELVEDSIFHPSPCRRHKERVLRHAVRAKVRQTISRRAMLAAGAAIVSLGMAIVVVRIATSSGETAAGNASPASATAVETNAAPASAQPAPAGSMGEGLFRASDRGDGRPAANGGL